MKKLFLVYALIFFSACELVEVESPNFSEDDFQGFSTSAEVWMNGMQRQLAQTVSTAVEYAELVSDNYYNNRTLSSKVFDLPQIENQDLDVRLLQSAIHKLREMADFASEELFLTDPTVSNDLKAEVSYLRGLSFLFSAEYYVALPVDALGQVQSSTALYRSAITEFEAALSLTEDETARNSYRMALARTHYYLGNRDNAQSWAQQVIDSDVLALRPVTFDGENGVNNSFQFFLYGSSADEFAPLPRLDFLDPKYFDLGNPQDQKGIAMFKSEEAYFIIAEAQIAQGNIAAAQTTLKNLITDVIEQRPTVMIDDTRETRSGGNRADYPLTSDVRVKFSADEPAREGFILDRQSGDIMVYAISGTSVTAADIDAATTEDAILEQLYLMRQEVFIAEGRRMVDLGIKFPVAIEEAENNSNVTNEHLTAQIPSFIPTNGEMDDFTYDEAAGVVTMDVNMNKVLVAQKASPFVLPFH